MLVCDQDSFTAKHDDAVHNLVSRLHCRSQKDHQALVELKNVVRSVYLMVSKGQQEDSDTDYTDLKVRLTNEEFHEVASWMPCKTVEEITAQFDTEDRRKMIARWVFSHEVQEDKFEADLLNKVIAPWLRGTLYFTAGT